MHLVHSGYDATYSLALTRYLGSPIILILVLLQIFVFLSDFVSQQGEGFVTQKMTYLISAQAIILFPPFFKWLYMLVELLGFCNI